EGNASANNFKVQSDSPRGWTDTTKVLSLGVNRTVSRTMTITFPNNAWDSTVDITLDIEESVESDYDNNSATISI
ncbi:MAG TPA: NEW3 domain-containing protein, partial [Aggregatilineales bacterium]|nr:NEW3 domain-containing protein [Aggregatilineales bacterium]